MVSYNLCCHTDCCEAPTKQCRKISAGMIVRFLYLCYAVLTIVVRTVALDEQKDFSDPMNVVKIVLLAAGIPLMIAEALYISIKRRGKELKW